MVHGPFPSKVETETLNIQKMPPKRDPAFAYKESGTINFLNYAINPDINTARKWTIQPRSFNDDVRKGPAGDLGLSSILPFRHSCMKILCQTSETWYGPNATLHLFLTTHTDPEGGGRV